VYVETHFDKLKCALLLQRNQEGVTTKNIIELQSPGWEQGRGGRTGSEDGGMGIMVERFAGMSQSVGVGTVVRLH